MIMELMFWPRGEGENINEETGKKELSDNHKCCLFRFHKELKLEDKRVVASCFG